MRVNYFCLFLAGLIAGMSLTEFMVQEGLKANTVEGYHCGKITKHISLESAKAQVLAYQTMTRG